MARVTLHIGDCYLIPLPDGRYAYGQYIYHESGPSGHGYLMQIYSLINETAVSIETLSAAGTLFPPVFVGLNASVKSGRWKKIGTLPVKDFTYPRFRDTLGTKPGTYHDWSIWDGKKHKHIGILKPEYRSLELLCVWGDELLEERIATGVNPFASLE